MFSFKNCLIQVRTYHSILAFVLYQDVSRRQLLYQNNRPYSQERLLYFIDIIIIYFKSELPLK